MKILYAERFTGEFEWELMCWIPHLRWLAEQHEYVITKCDPDYQFFYEFVDKFFLKRRPKYAIQIKGGGIPLGFQGMPGNKKFKSWLRKVNKKNLHIVWPTEKNCLDRKKMKFIQYGTYQKDLDYDLVLCAQKKRNYSKRGHRPVMKGWFIENWGELVDRLPKMRICSIGKTARYVSGTDDRRDLPWNSLCDLMQSSTMMLSPPCGHARLGGLCRLPLLSWTSNKKYYYGLSTETESHRYRISWNPFGVPVKMITHSAWKPSVNSVYKSTLSFMEKANEYRKYKNDD